MTRRLTEQKIKDLIEDLEFQPLKITVEKQALKAGEQAGNGASDDLLLNIAWKNNAEKFIAEVLGQATPKQIETKILRLEKFTDSKNSGRAARKRFNPLVIAPYLSEKTLNRLAEAEISGIDLSGNGVIIVPDKLFVFRARARKTNSFRARRLKTFFAERVRSPQECFLPNRNMKTSAKFWKKL